MIRMRELDEQVYIVLLRAARSSAANGQLKYTECRHPRHYARWGDSDFSRDGREQKILIATHDGIQRLLLRVECPPDGPRGGRRPRHPSQKGDYCVGAAQA